MKKLLKRILPKRVQRVEYTFSSLAYDWDDYHVVHVEKDKSKSIIQNSLDQHYKVNSIQSVFIQKIERVTYWGNPKYWKPRSNGHSRFLGN